MITYTVIEKQILSDETQAVLFQNYTDENLALSDMYSRLASASISTIPYHAVLLIKYDGRSAYISDGRVFDRSEPEPEPIVPEE